MGKIIKILGCFSLAMLLVIGFSCRKLDTESIEEFDGTLIVVNNSDFTVVVEIDGTVQKSDLAANSQWSTLLYQGPHTVKVRHTDGTAERVYEVDIVSGATTTIRYP
jgi:hypothetical protein